MKLIAYLEARLLERSTWAAISGAIVGAAALAQPYSYMAIGVGVIVALLPTSGAGKDN